MPLNPVTSAPDLEQGISSTDSLDATPTQQAVSGKLQSLTPDFKAVVTEIKDQYSAWDEAEAWAGATKDVHGTHQERIKFWNDELEYFLIYSSIFSAVITTFAAQTYTLLAPNGPDPTTMMFLQAILAREIGDQAGTATPERFTPPSILAVTSTVVTERSVVALNVLLFFSLICSLSATMFAVIIKQWLHNSLKEGHTTKYIARRNLFLFMNMDTWHIALFIAYLFNLLQVSVVLFFASLVLLLWHLHPVVAIAASLLVGCMLALAITSMVLPMIYSSCCYISPPTYQLYDLLQRCRYGYQVIVRRVVYAPLRWILLRCYVSRPRVRRMFPVYPNAIVYWDTRERESIFWAWSDLDAMLIATIALKPVTIGMHTTNEPSRDEAIVHLILDDNLELYDFLTKCFQHVHTTILATTNCDFRRSTISMDFWIASLLKMSYLQVPSDFAEGETPILRRNTYPRNISHYPLEVSTVMTTPPGTTECIAALKYIEAAYWHMERSHARDQRLLLALSLSAHHNSLQCRTLALHLLYLHLSSGDVFMRSSWQHICIGLIASERRLLVLSNEIEVHQREGMKLKEGIELVAILVRGCFLRHQMGALEDADADECDVLRECGLWTLTIFVRLLSIWAPPHGNDEVLEWISSMGRGVASVLEVMKELPRPLPEGAGERIAQVTSQADGWLNAADAEQRKLARRNKEAGHQAGRALQKARDACYELLRR